MAGGDSAFPGGNWRRWLPWLIVAILGSIIAVDEVSKRCASGPGMLSAAGMRLQTWEPLSPVEFKQEIRSAANASAEVASDVLRRLSGSTANVSDAAKADMHAPDVLLFMIISFWVGTLITYITTFSMFETLQQTVVLFILGMVFSLLMRMVKFQDIGIVGDSFAMWMSIDPHLLLFCLLPALLAGDAMTIDTTVAKRVAKQAIFLAGPGVLINAGITSTFLFLYLPHGWNFLLCFTLAAILGATDPVAVVALLKELGAPPSLTVLIQGEALLNDGTAIVLFRVSYAMFKGVIYYPSDVVIELVWAACCAIGLGAFTGYIFFLWIRMASNKFEHHSSMVQTALTVCSAYWTFILAEGILNMSGVLATVAGSLVLAAKMWPVIVNQHSLHTVWHMIEYLGNNLIFFLAGALMGNIMIDIEWQDYMHLVVIYIFVNFSRGFVLCTSQPILSRLGEDHRKVSAADLIVTMWGGLRGAVGLSLALQVFLDRGGLDAAGNPLISQADANRVLFYTGGIAALTLMCNATTCPALVGWLGITNMPETKRQVLLLISRQMKKLADGEEHEGAVRRALAVTFTELEIALAGSIDSENYAERDCFKRVELSDEDRHEVGVALKKHNKKAEQGDSQRSPSGERSPPGGSESSSRRKKKKEGKLPREHDASLRAGSKTKVEKREIRASASAAQGAGTPPYPSEQSNPSPSATAWTSGASRSSRASRAGAGSESNRRRSSVMTIVQERLALAARPHHMQSIHDIIDEMAEVKMKYNMIPSKQLQFQSGLPPMPFKDNETALMDILAASIMDLPMLRQINEIFFKLLQSSYSGQVQEGELVSGATETELLLSSLLQATSNPLDITDHRYVFPQVNRDELPSMARISQLGLQAELELNPDFAVQHHKEVNQLPRKIVNSKVFNITMLMFIIGNAIFIFVEESSVGTHNVDAFFILENLFTAAFTIELFLNIWAYTREFFGDMWRTFDSLLVVLAYCGIIIAAVAKNSATSGNDAAAADISSQGRLLRVARVFRVMRLLRLFRLFNLARSLWAKFQNEDNAMEIAEHMQKITILTCLAKAHVEAQTDLLRFLGDDINTLSPEIARCVLQSQVIVYKALAMGVREEQELPKTTLVHVAEVRESKRIADELQKFVDTVFHAGVLSSREAHAILEPLRDHTKHCQKAIRNSRAGYISRPTYEAEEKEEGLECERRWDGGRHSNRELPESSDLSTSSVREFDLRVAPAPEEVAQQ